jgi:hypothetical protein
MYGEEPVQATKQIAREGTLKVPRYTRKIAIYLRPRTIHFTIRLTSSRRKVNFMNSSNAKGLLPSPR